MLTPRLSYLLGVIFGDGNLTEWGIRIYNSSRPFLEEILNIFEVVFEVHPKVHIRFQRGHVYFVLRAFSTRLVQTLSSDYHFPTNKRTLELSENLMMADLLNKRYFIAGLFDTDGTVVFRKKKKYIRPYIGLEAKSLVFIKKVKTMLQSLGFYFTGPYKQKTCWNIRLEKEEQFKKFVSMIPMRHPKVKKIKIFNTNNSLWPG